MVRADQQQRVRDYIQLGIDEGARLVTGGPGVPEGLEAGNYVQPTLFADVDNSMRIAQEEIFGPVLVVIPFDGEDDAIRIANDSPYGLGGGVWTADQEHGIQIARQIRTGTFSVNGAPPASMDPSVATKPAASAANSAPSDSPSTSNTKPSRSRTAQVGGQ
jgi:acyl-CoA reductase-like NAD-dependent aldehyde dehydrogenase